MQNIAILMQGLAERIEAFVSAHPWLEPEDVFVLAYDRPVVEDLKIFKIHDPECSWAAGRNSLFEAARATGRFHGYIFMDDDVAFDEGDMRGFVGLCRANPDLFITPVVERTVIGRGVLDREFQRPLIIDDQMYYLSADLVQRSGVYPLVTDYDDISWWISGEICQQILLQHHWSECLQANRFRIANLLHRAGSEESNYTLSSLETVLEIAHGRVLQERGTPAFYSNFERHPVGWFPRRYWRLTRALRRLRARFPAHVRQPS
ncbi:hypothetical protein [Hoeflea sp.]|uniref:hypothetical protein n=1 Tax=Hoeflea sp. TaxID=1940281 RepID=UPI003B025C37